MTVSQQVHPATAHILNFGYLGRDRQIRQSRNTRSLGLKFNQKIANRNDAHVLGDVNDRGPKRY